jgi:hypothetical protein
MSRRLLAVGLLFAGLACFLLGSALAWGRSAMLGYTIGSAGTVALVVGAILFRQSMVGRFLDGEGEEEAR